jgi:hypothetical protein
MAPSFINSDMETTGIGGHHKGEGLLNKDVKPTTCGHLIRDRLGTRRGESRGWFNSPHEWLISYDQRSKEKPSRLRWTGKAFQFSIPADL